MRSLFLLAASSILWLSCASDPVSEAIDELAALSRVYVPMDPLTVMSLAGAVEEKGYGEVKADDLELHFVYSESSFGRALVAYSDEGAVPGNVTFQPMSVTQWLRSALADESASGVMLDPHTALPLTLAKAEVGRALEEIPAQPDVPLQLMR
jgi:hypothetical protein